MMGFAPMGRHTLPYYIFKEKERRTILKITKDEAEYIRQHSGNSRITITGKNKKSRSKRWYVDEVPESLTLLDRFRKSRLIKTY